MQWQVPFYENVPQWFQEAVSRYVCDSDGLYAAQLLWQRGIKDPLELPGFLDPDYYKPTSPFAFGQEMKWAIKRLQKARENGEQVTIWGDFDADGITATSVLWEGLGEFFPQNTQLNYYIPNRLRESHGLNCQGIGNLAASGTKLIVTCDTGSTNLTEIDLANQLGVDIIITDHHTLPENRPPVISILNPRYFSESHPLYHLSGVAVAYKLVEALYESFPDVPQFGVENLLDLVAIGLIADLVQLSGDCRYLAQKGIKRLQQQTLIPTRPGITRLLELCQKSGDRPTDISFGIGPRINAVSRIHGDAHFCVELLTSRQRKKCNQLALKTELANTRRKALQKDVTEEVKKKIARMDLSTTCVIVIDDPQWPSGILGLVAGQIAQEYGRPTILLTTAENDSDGNREISPKIARGSARSVHNIDLYQLLLSQSHLLGRFGGHPFAAGLSIPVENIPLFCEGINQQLRQQYGSLILGGGSLDADLIVTVSELGKSLFRELKLLEPCGMGNPVPRLLIQNCWFDNLWQNNSKDIKGKKIQYIKTTFRIWDNSVSVGFPGVWWGHYKDEIPLQTPCDAIVELDYNSHHKDGPCYQVRLIAIRPKSPQTSETPEISPLIRCLDRGIVGKPPQNYLLDWRENRSGDDLVSPVVLQHCPTNWTEIQQQYQRALALNQPLALAYTPPLSPSPEEIWKQLIGIGKYLCRQGKTVSRQQLREKLDLSDYTLELGLKALSCVGFNYHLHQDTISLNYEHQTDGKEPNYELINHFLAAIKEEQFQRQYFYQIPLSLISEQLSVV